MAVTAQMVKELRETTGAGMKACKEALVQADGDMEQAGILLREKGLATAAKRSGKVASEGLALCFIDDSGNAGIVEVNSETDFVAKNEEFRALVEGCAKIAAKTGVTTVEEFAAEKWDDGQTVNDVIGEKTGKIGESLRLRRFKRLVKDSAGAIVSYVHGGGKIAVLVYLKCDKPASALDEAAKNVAMQVAAMNPKFISKNDMDESFIASEREILLNQAKQDESLAGKPDKVIAGIVEGRLQKEFKEFCLTEQQYIKGDGESVSKYLEGVAKETGAPVVIAEFVRFEVGEGLEKKEEDFAAEVAKAMGN